MSTLSFSLRKSASLRTSLASPSKRLRQASYASMSLFTSSTSLSSLSDKILMQSRHKGCSTCNHTQKTHIWWPNNQKNHQIHYIFTCFSQQTCVCVVAISNARVRTVIVELNPELWGGKWPPESAPVPGECAPPPSVPDSDLYTTTNDSSMAFPGCAAAAAESLRGRWALPWAWGLCLGSTTYELSIFVALRTLLAPWTEDPCIPTPILSSSKTKLFTYE